MTSDAGRLSHVALLLSRRFPAVPDSLQQPTLALGPVLGRVAGVDLSGLPIYDLVRPVCLSNAVGQTTLAFRSARSLSEPIRPRLTGTSQPSPRRPLHRRIPSGRRSHWSLGRHRTNDLEQARPASRRGRSPIGAVWDRQWDHAPQNALRGPSNDPTERGQNLRISRQNKRWRDPDSNWGHHDFQSCALPTELSRRTSCNSALAWVSWPAAFPSMGPGVGLTRPLGLARQGG